MVGSVPIGDGAPVAVQSMATTDTRDIEGTLSQIEGLASVGCEIIRLAVVDQEAAIARGQMIPLPSWDCSIAAARRRLTPIP